MGLFLDDLGKALREEYRRLLLDGFAFKGHWDGFERGVQAIILSLVARMRAGDRENDKIQRPRARG